MSAGFTLIELLVVLAIIALLTSVAIVALVSARSKSRNAKRISDIRNLATAFELYFDTCGSYPVIAPGAAVILNSTRGMFTGTVTTPTACGDNTGSGNNGGIRTTSLGTSIVGVFSPAPTPADFTGTGTCDTTATGAPSTYTTITTWPASSSWNDYVYTGNAGSFQITFCLGATTGGLAAGKHVLNQNGMQ